MLGFGEGLFGSNLFGGGLVPNTFELWDFPPYREEDYDWEPVFGDYDYDYGVADDGTPNPPPCIVCQAPYGACTNETHLAGLAALE